jgi:UDP-glucuronate 4-epimerase
MNYLITGGAGFIGSKLVGDLLNNGDSVVVVDNFDSYYDPKIKEKNIEKYFHFQKFHLEKLNILNFELFDDVFTKYRIDFVVHLAAKAGVRPSLEDPISYQRVNGEGTINVLECARRHGVKKLILASSSSVYGNNKNVPFKETDCVDFAISPYAATKKANEVMAHVYHAVYGLDIFMLRFFTVYGPRQRPDLAINKFTRLIEAGEPIVLYGDGKTYRDYTYVDDICDGIEGVISYLSHHDNVYEILNLGSNYPITLLEMVQTIEKGLGKKAIINFLPMQPGDVNATYADISKAKRLIGYEPHTTFEQGIKKFIEWEKANR